MERNLLVEVQRERSLGTFPSFAQSIVVHSGFRVEHLRADKEGEYINKDFKDYFLQAGVLLEYASTKMLQKISMPEHIGITIAAMVRRTFTDSGRPNFI